MARMDDFTERQILLVIFFIEGKNSICVATETHEHGGKFIIFIIFSSEDISRGFASKMPNRAYVRLKYIHIKQKLFNLLVEPTCLPARETFSFFATRRWKLEVGSMQWFGLRSFLLSSVLHGKGGAL